MESPPAKRLKSSTIRSDPMDDDDTTPAWMTRKQDLICFGTLSFTPNTMELSSTETGATPVEVSVSEGRILSHESKCHLATLSPRDADIMNLIIQEGIEIEVILIPTPFNTQSKIQLLPRVMVTLFRLQKLEGAWIDFLQDQALYLQDPIHTKRKLPYWNPQRFFNEVNAYTSDFWQNHEPAKTRQEETSPVDFLAAFSSDNDFVETEGSIFLQSQLHTHQKKALTFMVNRERGWNLEQDGADIWSLKWDQDSQYKYFINNIDLAECSDPPPPFKGGILADVMGSGKTLCMISLIAHDRNNGLRHDSKSAKEHLSRCTLVVMPSHILQTWDKELSKHLPGESFSWLHHHGPSKLKDESDIATTDIVLITYQTLASDWRSKSSSIIFRHSWHRVILDEGSSPLAHFQGTSHPIFTAHRIKDPTTITAKAAFALKSDRRWVVTGTPIQNRLSELSSLFQFLQVFPYSNRKIFDECITKLWASGKAEEAVERLKRLLNFTMLRRSQFSLNLPKRTDLKVFLDFDEHERNIYNAARDKTMRSLDDLISSQSTESYLNALQKINSLRLICNLGRPTINERILHTESLAPPKQSVWDESRARQTLVSLCRAGIPLICVNCATAIDTLFDMRETHITFQVTKCLQIRCPSCYDNSAFSGIQMCICSSGCSSVALQLTSLAISSANTQQPLTSGNLPTKIRHLIQDLKKHSPEDKCIVFSSWKTTLDVAFGALETAGISSVKVDGRVKLKQREQIFHDFTHTESTRVLLLSLSCGSSGLTLTAASRVYLMEPQWNPSTEEQAMGRVYRISQTRDVTTIRYVMDNSIEKHVLAVQDGKKDLITLLFSCPGTASLKLTKQRLMELKQLL